MVCNETIKVRNYTFKKVEKFKFLGSVFTSKNGMREESKRWLQSGSACYFGLNKLSCFCLLSGKVKIRLHKTIILLIVLYRCKTWLFTHEDENNFSMFGTRALRRIFGTKSDDHDG